jgi:hypothetical protein
MFNLKRSMKNVVTPLFVACGMSVLAGLSQAISLIMIAMNLKTISSITDELNHDGRGPLVAKMLHGLHVSILVHLIGCFWYFSIAGLILLAISRLKNSSSTTSAPKGQFVS